MSYRINCIIQYNTIIIYVYTNLDYINLNMYLYNKTILFLYLSIRNEFRYRIHRFEFLFSPAHVAKIQT